MWILRPGVLELVRVTDRYERSLVASYWNAIRRYLNTGDDFNIRQFEGVRITGRRLLTDLAEIEEWARHGDFDFDSIYSLVT
jgi:hypothetical protein